MALNIKNKEVEKIAGELSRMTGKSMTGAVLVALKEYRDRITASSARKRRLKTLIEFMEDEVWSLPDDSAAKMSDDELLGYGKSGA